MLDTNIIQKLPLYTGLDIARGMTKRLFAELPINSFYHMLVYPDNSWVGLTTDIAWMDDCFFSENQYFYSELACDFDALFSTRLVGHVSIVLDAWQAPSSIKEAYLKYFLDRGKEYIIFIGNKNDVYYETLYFTMNSLQDLSLVLAQYDKLMLLVEELNCNIAVDKTARSFYHNEKVSLNAFKNKGFINLSNSFEKISGLKNFSFQDKVCLNSQSNNLFVTTQEALCMEKVHLHCCSIKDAASKLNISQQEVQNNLNNAKNRLQTKSYYTDMLKKIVSLDHTIRVRV